MEKTFKQWMRTVNHILIEALGVGVYDLIDLLWRDWYDAGWTPEEVAEPILENPYDYI